MENIPVFDNPGDMIKFSEKLRKNNLTEAMLIYDSGRIKVLHKMTLEENGFYLEIEKDLTPKKNLKYVKNSKTGKMELDFN
jgi:hypothetical protein